MADYLMFRIIFFCSTIVIVSFTLLSIIIVDRIVNKLKDFKLKEIGLAKEFKYLEPLEDANPHLAF